MVETVLSILGGLGLFLFAVSRLSEVLKDAMGDRAEKFLQRITRNLFMGLLAGTIITVVLDSSSAVIILTIVLVNAGVLSFKNAIGVVMGANIGTTFSSQLIALDIGKFSPIPIIIGLVLSLAARNKSLSKGGQALLYFGILFFGLYTMERSVEPLRESAFFTRMMERMSNPLLGAGAGAITTLIVQSSSATVGMVITLAKKGLIGLPGAIAVMLGAELGTCSDTLLATIRSDRQAVKTGIFHLFFNLITIILGLLLFPLFVGAIESISGSAELEQKVANAHMLFNMGGVLLFLPFVGLVARLLDRLIPEKRARLAPELTAKPELV
jgi:phosphate:Na+ symporter